MHSSKCKWWYAVYTIPSLIYYRMCGIHFEGTSFFAGRAYISKCRNSSITIGKSCRFMSKETGNLLGINHRCIIATSNSNAKLEIGNECSFSGSTIWCFEHIKLGNHVRVGANVTIMDGDAHQDDPRVGKDSPIIIEDNVWIGACAVVMKGVTIGRNSVIGAGSVVTKDIPENVVAAGNPCRVVKQLDESVIKQIDA